MSDGLQIIVGALIGYVIGMFPSADLVTRLASRGTIDANRLETLMRECEEVINGRPCTWRESIDLVRRLREVERDLGLGMRQREARQAAENI